MRRPDASITVGLQLERDGIAVRLGAARGALFGPARGIPGTKQLLHVMADLMRDHIGLRKIPRRAEARRQLVEELQVEIDALVTRTIERSHRGLTEAALRAGRLIVKDKGIGRLIGPAHLPELRAPNIRGRGG